MATFYSNITTIGIRTLDPYIIYKLSGLPRNVAVVREARVHHLQPEVRRGGTSVTLCLLRLEVKGVKVSSGQQLWTS